MYKRVLLKISGEALASAEQSAEQSFGIDPRMVEKIAQDIKRVHDGGTEVVIVVGGGNIYRGLDGAARHAMDRTTSDQMGMLATVINGLALRSAIESIGIHCRVMSAISMPTIGEPYSQRRASRHMEKGRVVICVAGTGNPFFTTDTAAALRASELSCDLLLKATKVSGVYTKDPKLSNDAEFLPIISYDDVLRLQLKIMDETAFTLIKDNKIPIAVFSIYEPNGFYNTIHGTGTFTLIR
ncbi:MAG: UMP kinase [Alphaproteobacteria bacterium]|nr:UMP kinase [Alphaproteobacteria bacterium]